MKVRLASLLAGGAILAACVSYFSTSGEPGRPAGTESGDGLGAPPMSSRQASAGLPGAMEEHAPSRTSIRHQESDRAAVSTQRPPTADSPAIAAAKQWRSARKSGGRVAAAAPAILAAPAPGMDLTEGDVEVWDEISRSFIDQVGGENQDPSAPDYLDRWNASAPQADYRFKLHFGRQAFIRQNAAVGTGDK